MLLSLIARFADAGAREVNRHEAWQEALEQLRLNARMGRRTEPRQLLILLRDLPPAQRPEAAQDLVAEALRLEWRAGPGAQLERFTGGLAGEFPELASPAAVPVALIEDEFLARHQLPHGDLPAISAYIRRFPGRGDLAARFATRCLDGGRFVLLHRLGVGAMGDVWEACDRERRAAVALKRAARHAVNPGEAARGLAAEARVTSGLDHPGIVRLREHTPREGGAPFYVMRLARGRTLSERIREFHARAGGASTRQRAEGLRELVRILIRAGEAMAHAHERGVVHRDLKPGHFSTEDSGEVLVLDWGMAARLDGHPAAGHCPQPLLVAGTPEYMAPEQLAGVADERTDVFGLGATLYEMLTGRCPQGWAEGVRPAAWREAVHQAAFAPPRQIEPHVPREMEAACLKALERRPEDRFQSVNELGHALRRCLADE